MPFCEACDRHWTPSSMRPDGSCPTCGRVLPVVEARRPRSGARGGSPEARAARGGVDGEAVGAPAEDGVDTDGGEGEDDLPAAPWHFKLMLAALAIYLGWRAVQGVEWLVQQL